MLHQLQQHLTDEDLGIIKNVMIKTYIDYLKMTVKPDFASLFAEEYAPHNRQYGVSWAISSAFPSKKRIGSFNVSRFVYGKGHTRPCLSTDTIELLILNSTTHFNAAYLQEKYKYNRNDFQSKKLFAYIYYVVDHKKLTQIALYLPDENGKVVEKLILMQDTTIQKMAV